MSNKMSPKQFNAYMKLDYDVWRSANDLKFSLSTLNALVNKGYAEKTTVFGVGGFLEVVPIFVKRIKQYESLSCLS